MCEKPETGSVLRAGMTWNTKTGAALWLHRAGEQVPRLAARVVGGLDASHVTEDDPQPRWHKDAMVFVDAVNASVKAPAPPEKPEAAEPTLPEMKVVHREGSRAVWLRIDNQTFPIAVEDVDEADATPEEHAAWMADMLRVALDKIRGRKRLDLPERASAAAEPAGEEVDRVALAIWGALDRVGRIGSAVYEHDADDMEEAACAAIEALRGKVKP